jgi:hypothetical protein
LRCRAVLFFDVSLEVAQSIGPERSIAFDPLRGVAHGRGVELAATESTVALASHESGVLENAEVFRERWMNCSRI